MAAKKKSPPRAPTPIVSSEHLASEKGWQLSELEFGLTIANNAFSRWMVRCMAAVGYPDLAPLDILVVHNVNHRKRPKRVSDICFMLNVEDTHTVTYSLKKLLKAGLVEGDRRGKEVFYRTTETGAATCRRYREVREECLIASLELLDEDGGANIRDAATLLRALSGLYDQAARAAASL
jgi:predicted MarR family transcription regulator